MNNHFIRLTSTKFVVFSKSFCHGNNVTFSFSTKRSHFIFESFISIISTRQEYNKFVGESHQRFVFSTE